MAWFVKRGIAGGWAGGWYRGGWCRGAVLVPKWKWSGGEMYRVNRRCRNADGITRQHFPEVLDSLGKGRAVAGTKRKRVEEEEDGAKNLAELWSLLNFILPDYVSGVVLPPANERAPPLRAHGHLHRHAAHDPQAVPVAEGDGGCIGQSEFEETPADDELSDPEPQIQPEEILPPVLKKTRYSAHRVDLCQGRSLLALLEDDLPLSFYDMQADELLEPHRVGVVVTLPRAHPTRYLDAYWEGWVRVLRMRPIDTEEDSYPLYKIRQLETRVLEWRDRWLVVREGNIHLCRDEERTIHTLALSHLLQLTNSGLPPAATPSSKTRVLLARFGPGQQKPSSLGSTRASSPIGMTRFDYSDSDSNLSSPVFAHDSSDSNRPRRKLQKRARKRPDPEFLAMDLKDDAAYVSLLRVFHRHTLPRSTFVDKLPVGTADFLPHAHPHASPFAHHPHPDDDADDPTPPALRHPPSLAHLRAPPRGLSLGALPYPEWRTGLLQRARRAGLGRIGRAVEWVLWNGNGSAAEEGEWMLEGQSPVRSRRGTGKGKGAAQRERGRGRRAPKPTSTDGYDSDDEDPDPGAASDGSSSSAGSGRGWGGARSETEWEGWMGDLRRQARVAADEHIRESMRLEAQRRAEESRDAELGLPPLPPGATASSAAEVTISRVGTGADDRQRRAALEPSAFVTSLSGVNPPTHAAYHHPPPSQSHHGHGASPSAGSSTSGGAHMLTPVLSSPSSNESLGFAFAPRAELGDDDAAAALHAHAAYMAHTRAHSHTLLHSVSMHDVHPHGYAHGYAHPLHMNFPASHGGAGPLAFDAAFARRPSMPVIGSGARWGEGSRPSTAERDAGGSSTGVTEVPRAGASASLGRSGSVGGGKGLLRKRDGQREREREQSDASDWRKGKERERERSPIPAFTARRPRLSVSTTDPPRVSSRGQPQQVLSPPATPLTEHAHLPAPDTLNPLVPVKKKRRNLARGVSIRAEKFVKSLDSALDFVDGR
ncbi:hypothetical protein DFH08DRAFT_1044443 [Mycena albidolilacea]|uniref:Uncharacterized protein n=1 Tax=Mycena albidolilacea TaxID=1033008 RepID=A0AAD6Z973_9AGAR|nr:hypothetical protein DFH08DRAFT_1044443 [Mycena albidolilacea]